MSKRSVVILPQTQAILSTMGEQIKMARLRRKLSVELVAQRAGISRATLWSVEKGCNGNLRLGSSCAEQHG